MMMMIINITVIIIINIIIIIIGLDIEDCLHFMHINTSLNIKEKRKDFEGTIKDYHLVLIELLSWSQDLKPWQLTLRWLI